VRDPKYFPHGQLPHLGVYPYINQVNTENGRHYDTSDGSFPSITSVLSILSEDAIKNWASLPWIGEEKAEKIKNVAGYKGTQVHSLLEKYVCNCEVKFGMPDKEALFYKMKPLVDQIEMVFASEIALYSKEYGVAGTCDLIADFQGELSVIDFKTSIKEKKREFIDGYFMQTTAYSLMFEEIYGIKIDKIVIMIGVNDGHSQLFTDSRKNWIEPLKKTIKEYNEYLYTNNTNSFCGNGLCYGTT